MALVYVAHEYGGKEEHLRHAREIMRMLQTENTEDCFMCPLMVFSHLRYGEIGRDAEMELCIDLLSVCDSLLVASAVSDGVQREIDFARMVGMDIEWL